MSFLDEKLPETAQAFADMRASLFKDSALDTKTKEIIATAASVLMRCEFCAKVHSQRAISNGATDDEIAEAIAVAMFIAGGSQLHWTKIYNDMFEKKEEDS